MDDLGALIRRIAEHDAAAFEAVYDAHHRLVYGIALRMLGDGTAAEDIVQHVFLKLWSAPHDFRGGNFAAWLARVTRNRCVDVLRRRAAMLAQTLASEIVVASAPEDEVFARISTQIVRRAVASLPDDQRRPIELGFFGGITHEEIARRTATPLGTVKTRIRAGLRRLRATLEPSVRA